MISFYFINNLTLFSLTLFNFLKISPHPLFNLNRNHRLKVINPRKLTAFIIDVMEVWASVEEQVILFCVISSNGLSPFSVTHSCFLIYSIVSLSFGSLVNIFLNKSAYSGSISSGNTNLPVTTKTYSDLVILS